MTEKQIKLDFKQRVRVRGRESASGEKEGSQTGGGGSMSNFVDMQKRLEEILPFLDARLLPHLTPSINQLIPRIVW